MKQLRLGYPALVKVLLLGVLLLGSGLIRGGELRALSHDITSVSPSLTVYSPGQTIYLIGGVNVFQPQSTFGLMDCDKLVWDRGGILSFFTQSNSISQYQGLPNTTSGDTIVFVIPDTMPCGIYQVYVDRRGTCSSPGTVGFAVTIEIGPAQLSAVAYLGADTFCVGEPNVLPTTYSFGTYWISGGISAPNSILLNDSTGLLGFHSGTSNTTQVLNFRNGRGAIPTCVDTVTRTIVIPPATASSFGYGQDSFCSSLGLVPLSTLANPPNGVFSSAPPGLIFGGGVPGTIDLASSVGGTYVVTYTPSVNSCATPTDTFITVVPVAIPAFSYPPFFCSNDSAGYPLITNLPPGGRFHKVGPGTVKVDSLTGVIDVVNSSVGNFMIECFTTTNSCFAPVSAPVTIAPHANATFTCPPSICGNLDTFRISGFLPGGAFYSNTPDIVWRDSVNGIIDVYNSNTGGPFVFHHYMPDPQCPDSTQDTLFIVPKDTAELNYPDSVYCSNATWPSPVFLSGVSGGYYTSTAVIDSFTGVINLITTVPASHTVNYTTPDPGCPTVISFATIIVKTAPDAAFNYAQQSYCQSLGGLLPTTATTTGWVTETYFLQTMNGTFLNGLFVGNTLRVDSTPPGGPYRIIRIVENFAACKDSAMDYISILPMENADFVYIPGTYCLADQDPVPLILGDGGGKFKALAPILPLDSMSGLIDVSASTAGIHLIQYTTPGPCPDIYTDTVTIVNDADPSFEYLQEDYCNSDTSSVLPQGTPPGSVNFHFSVDTVGLDLNTGSGMIHPYLCTPGSYVVTLHLDNLIGACALEHDVNINILAYNDTLAIDLDTANFCKAFLYTWVKVIPPTAGRFSGSAQLAWADRDTGQIALYATPAGIHSVFFKSDGVCAEEIDTTINVVEPLNPFFNFLAGAYCQSDSFALPDTIASLGGYFTDTAVGTPGNLVWIDDSLGIIDLLASDPVQYEVTYQTAGCPGQFKDLVEILPNPSLTIGYVPIKNEYCAGDSILATAGGAFTYSFYLNNDTTELMVDHIFSSYPANTVFTIHGKDIANCVGILVDTITVNPLPVATHLVPTYTVTGNQEISFLMTTDAPSTNFRWEVFPDGPVEFDEPGDSIGPIDPNFTIPISVGAELTRPYSPAKARFHIWPNARGCYGPMDSVSININPADLDIFIPEAFTPNGDGVNDRWEILWNSSILPEDYIVEVFNRSGGRVLEKDELWAEWNGDGLPDGVYWWRVRAKNNSYDAKGAVTIKRGYHK